MWPLDGRDTCVVSPSTQTRPTPRSTAPPAARTRSVTDIGRSRVAIAADGSAGGATAATYRGHRDLSIITRLRRRPAASGRMLAFLPARAARHATGAVGVVSLSR